MMLIFMPDYTMSPAKTEAAFIKLSMAILERYEVLLLFRAGVNSSPRELTEGAQMVSQRTDEKTFQVVYSGSDVINVLAVSPDAGWLACGSENSSIKMIPLNGYG